MSTITIPGSAQVFINSVIEFELGTFGGLLIDSVFPTPTQDASLVQDIIEVGAQMGLAGVVTGVTGQFVIRNLDPSNVTGGLPFTLGIFTGMPNMIAKISDINSRLKIGMRQVQADAVTQAGRQPDTQADERSAVAV